jgi:hypothetical protein
MFMPDYHETPALQALLRAADGEGQFPPPSEAFIATALKEIALVLRALDQRCAAIQRGSRTPTIHYTTDSDIWRRGPRESQTSERGIGSEGGPANPRPGDRIDADPSRSEAKPITSKREPCKPFRHMWGFVLDGEWFPWLRASNHRWRVCGRCGARVPRRWWHE